MIAATAAALMAYVQKRHAVEIRRLLGIFVRHTYAKQSTPAKRGQPRKDVAAAGPATSNSSSLAFEDIVAVKELVDRFGKESLTRLVEVL